MKAKSFFLILSFLLLLFSCSKKDEANKDVGNNYNKGEITILTDDSFRSVTEALADAYMINYPETKVNVKVVKEDLALLSLLQGKERLIVMSRELTPEEISEYERIVDLKFDPDPFAADAVVFVVSKNSSRNSVSTDEIREELNSDEKNLIFDGANSSNLNFVAQKIGAQPKDLKYSVISGNANVVEQIHQYPNKIGVVGLNTLSRPYGKDAQELRQQVKILSVVENGKTYTPSIENLRNLTYPYSRIVYFINNEGGFGLARGIIRFSCTQKGQIVVQKEGLQPYNLFKREVEMR